MQLFSFSYGRIWVLFPSKQSHFKVREGQRGDVLLFSCKCYSNKIPLGMNLAQWAASLPVFEVNSPNTFPETIKHCFAMMTPSQYGEQRQKPLKISTCYYYFPTEWAHILFLWKNVHHSLQYLHQRFCTAPLSLISSHRQLQQLLFLRPQPSYSCAVSSCLWPVG